MTCLKLTTPFMWKKVGRMCLSKIIGIFKISPVSGEADLKILWESCHYFNPRTVCLCKLHILSVGGPFLDERSTRTGRWGDKGLILSNTRQGSSYNYVEDVILPWHFASVVGKWEEHLFQVVHTQFFRPQCIMIHPPPKIK